MATCFKLLVSVGAVILTIASAQDCRQNTVKPASDWYLLESNNQHYLIFDLSSSFQNCEPDPDPNALDSYVLLGMYGSSEDSPPATANVLLRYAGMECWYGPNIGSESCTSTIPLEDYSGDIAGINVRSRYPFEARQHFTKMRCSGQCVVRIHISLYIKLCFQF